MRKTIPLPSGGNLPTREWSFNGFNQGVNSFALATELKGSELAEMTNGELYGKRSVRPRRGGDILGGEVGSAGVIDGLFQYKEGLTKNELLAINKGVLRKYNIATATWDTVSGGSFTTDLRTRGVKMRSNLYFGNGIDSFSRYNGTLVSFFTAVAAPTGLAVDPQGSTGTEKYEYTVTTVTDKGQSLPATNVSIVNGNVILDTTNYNRITFTRRTETQVIGYNVYGRKTTDMGVTLLFYIDQPASGETVTWDDKGTVAPQLWLPPDGDSTDGPSLKFWEQLRGSLIGAGDPDAVHRLYYSGTGLRYESFSPSHNGGWVDVRPGDNDAGVNGLAPFENKIILGKERSIHQFYFSDTTGDAVIQELITYVGCGAPGSMVIMENDVAFIDSEKKLRILGYEPNFAAAIRTASLSEGRVQSLYNDINGNYISNCEGVYNNGRYYLAYTPTGETINKKVLVYDRKYLAFLGVWDGADCHVRCWLVYDGFDNKQRLYVGGSDTNKVWEFITEGLYKNYDGSAISTVIRTRNEDLGNSGQSKLFKWADLRIFRIKGTIKLKTIINGAQVIDVKPFSSSSSRTGWGIVMWGVMRWGLPTGTPALASDLDKTYRKELYEIGNSLQFEITKDDTISDFTLVSMRGEALMLPEEVFESSNVI